jgi:hypothetical protein
MIKSMKYLGGESVMADAIIHSVWIDDSGCDTEGVPTYLGVNLMNGHNAMLSLSLTPKAADPLIADIIAGRCNTKPKTDGERVYWENGASLTIDEIITMLQAADKGEEKS